MCVIRLHNVCNHVTQRGKPYYTRWVTGLHNVKRHYLAHINCSLVGMGAYALLNKVADRLHQR